MIKISKIERFSAILLAIFSILAILVQTDAKDVVKSRS